MKRILSCSILNERIEAIDNILVCIRQTEARERGGWNRTSHSIYSSSSRDDNRYAGYHNRQPDYHANDQNINIKMHNAKEIGRLDDGKNLLDVILYGSPENGIASHVAIARKALLGDDRNAESAFFNFLQNKMY